MIVLIVIRQNTGLIIKPSRKRPNAIAVMPIWAPIQITIAVATILTIVQYNPRSVRPIAICKLPTGFPVELTPYVNAMKASTNVPSKY